MYKPKNLELDNYDNQTLMAESLTCEACNKRPELCEALKHHTYLACQYNPHFWHCGHCGKSKAFLERERSK